MSSLSKKYREILRFPRNFRDRKRLKNNDFSLLSNNCVGGVISHELGLPFKSPTINLWMKSEDYLKFLENIEYYLSVEPHPVESELNYPVGMLDDVTIYFQHYPTFEEAVKKWNQRKARIDWDNLMVVFVYLTEQEDETVRRFLQLPYKNKALLTYYGDEANNIFEMKAAKKLHSEGKPLVGGLTGYRSKFTAKRWLDDFDFVSFFNSSK